MDAAEFMRSTAYHKSFENAHHHPMLSLKEIKPKQIPLPVSTEKQTINEKFGWIEGNFCSFFIFFLYGNFRFKF